MTSNVETFSDDTQDNQMYVLFFFFLLSTCWYRTTKMHIHSGVPQQAIASKCGCGMTPHAWPSGGHVWTSASLEMHYNQRNDRNLFSTIKHLECERNGTLGNCFWLPDDREKPLCRLTPNQWSNYWWGWKIWEFERIGSVIIWSVLQQ